ncbi:thioredoxin [Anderseniella sp. Alg231-50]|uniref:thioredoxin n=1 Tax=Anderseniella sp. Alg231-50 TaxID=1922226 RepID=UPI00307B3FE4
MTNQTFSMGTSFNAGGTTPAPETGPSAAQLIKESDTANFMTDVIEASKSVPVLVDFWAPWCGPCKQLGPLLEKIVTEAGGKVRLVKVDIDANQQLAQQMRIQSIPAVFAFADGQPVDGFMGALPESELRTFIDKIVSSHGGQAEQVEKALEAAEAALEAEAADEAMAMFEQVLQLEPENGRAIAGMAKAFIAVDNLEGARELLAVIPPALVNDAHVSGALAALTVAETPVDDGEITRLNEAVAADETDFQSRLDLSVALNAAGQEEAALDHLMWLIEKDRAWNDDAARKQLLVFFEAWGPTHELTLSGRRRLSSILFA